MMTERTGLVLQTCKVILALTVYLLCDVVLAIPDTVSVCVQVLNDNDSNPAEGGAFNFSVGGGVSGDLTNGNGVTVNRTEDLSATPATCAAPVNFQANSTELSVFTSTFPWPRNASGFPQWEIVNSVGTVLATGSGQAAGLDAVEFAAIPDGEDIMLTFDFAEGRFVTVCKTVEDNGAAAPDQGGAFNFNFTSITGSPSLQVTADETIGQQCPGEELEIDFGDTTMRVVEALSGFVSEVGFPQWVVSDNSAQPDVTFAGSNIFNELITQLEDDLLVEITNRAVVITTIPMQFCGVMFDNGSADSLNGRFAHRLIGNNPPVNRLESVPLVPESTPGSPLESCDDPFNVNANTTTFLAGLISYEHFIGPGGAGTVFEPWEGNAPGFPQWELRDQNDTVLASGTGDFFNFDRAADTVNGIPQPPGSTLTTATMFKLVFIHQEGDFGNGADADTGAIIRSCRFIEDNGDAIVDEYFGDANTIANRLDGPLPGGVSTNTDYIFGGIFNNPAADELTGIVCDDTATAKPDFLDEHIFTVADYFANNASSWRGSAVGFPRLRVSNDPNVAGMLTVPTPGDLGIDEPMVLNGNFEVNDSAAVSVLLTQPGDLNFIVTDRAPSPNTYEFCFQYLDNALPPLVDTEVRLTSVVQSGPNFIEDIAVSEGGSVVCGTPTSFSGWPTGRLPDLRFQLDRDEADLPETRTIDRGFSRARVEAFEPGTTNLVGSFEFLPNFNGFTSDFGRAGITDIIVSLGPLWDGTVANCESFGGCDLRITGIVLNGPQQDFCKQVLPNGNLIDDSDTFALALGNTGFNLTATEGGPPVCVGPSQRFSNSLTATVFNYSEQLPAAWLNAPFGQTPGFPLWSYTDTFNTTPVEGSGNVVAIPVGCTPGNPLRPGGPQEDLSICPFIQGNLTATFINRLGPLQSIQFCKEVLGNSDGVLNQGGAFTLNGRHDDASTLQFGNSVLNITENGDADSLLTCTSAVDIPTLATSIGGSLVQEPAFNPPQWPGNSPGFPQWRIQDSIGTVASGSGANTDNVAITSLAGDVQVVFTSLPNAIADIEVTKTVNGQAATSDWVFSATSATSGCLLTSPVTITTLGAGGTSTFSLPVNSSIDGTPCVYTVTETTQPGYDITALSCSVGVNDPPASVTDITLSPSTPVTCGFENTPILDLALTKTLTSPGPFSPGDTVMFNIVVTNNAPIPATDVMITDVPTNLTFLSHTGSTCAPATFPCTIPSLGVGASETLTVTATIDAAGAFINEATVIPDGTDSDTSDNTDSDGSIAPVVVVTKTLIETGGTLSGIAEAGEQLTYQILLENAFAIDAFTSINETVPANTTAAGGDDFDCNAGDPAGTVCAPAAGNPLTVPANGSLTLNFVVNVDDPIPDGVLTITNTATSGGPNDPGCPNSPNDCMETTPTEPNISVAKTLASGGPQAGPGDTLTYNITLTNTGGTDQVYTAGQLQETVPANTTAAGGDSFDCVAGDPSGTVCSNPVDVVVPLDGSITLTFSVVIDDPIPAGVTSIDNAVIVPDECPDDVANDCVESTPTVSQLVAVKSVAEPGGAAAGIAEAGETLEYTISITNNGGSVANDVSVTDPVNDAGIDVVPTQVLQITNASDVTPAGPTIADLQAGITLDIAAGDTATITYTVTVSDPIADGDLTIDNVVLVDDGSDVCAEVNSNCTTSIPTEANISVAKTLASGGPDAVPGETLVYNIVLTNVGGSDLTYLAGEIQESVPLNTTAVGGDDFDCTAGDPSGTVCSNPVDVVVPLDGSIALTFSVVVDDPIPAGVTSIDNAVIVPDECPDDVANDCVESTPTVSQLVAVKSVAEPGGAAAGIAEAGETLEYTISITNNGGSVANDVSVTDPVNDAGIDVVPTQVLQITNASDVTPAGPTIADLQAGITLDIAAGDTATITYTVTVSDPIADGDLTIDNVVLVDDGSDVCAEVNSNCTTSIPTEANISVAKTLASGGPDAVPGETLIYNIVLTNTGGTDQTYTAGQLQETVPLGTTAAGGDDFDCTAGDPSGTVCSNPVDVVVPLDGSIVLTFSVVVDDPIPAGVTSIDNAVIVPGECPDDPANDCDEVTALADADVLVDKALVSEAPYFVGDVVEFAITVTNNGPGGATNIVVEDTLTNMTLVSVSSASCNSFPCTIPSLQVGESEVITVLASIDVFGEFINAVTVSADQPDPDLTNNDDSVSAFTEPLEVPVFSRWALLLLALLIMTLGTLVMNRTDRQQ